MKGVYLAAAYGDPDYRVQVWQLPEAQSFFSLPTRHFTRVAYAQDGHLLVTVAANPDYEEYGQAAGYVQLWKAVNGKALLQLDIDDAVSAALSPDSQILDTGSLDDTLRLWDAAGGSCSDKPGSSWHLSSVQPLRRTATACFPPRRTGRSIHGDSPPQPHSPPGSRYRRRQKAPGSQTRRPTGAGRCGRGNSGRVK